MRVPHHPIQKLIGMLILKQLENLIDESTTPQGKRNPYYQYFCGMMLFQHSTGVEPTQLQTDLASLGEGTQDVVTEVTNALDKN